VEANGRTTSSDRVKIAVVGCGAVSELRHLPALAAGDGREISALVDKDEARVRRLADEYGAQHALTDHRELIGLGLDGAIVATPTNLHAPMTIDLLRGGLHVLVEKPIARNLYECDAMIAAAQEMDRVLAVAFFRRFAHQLRLTKTVLDAGLLGTIRSFDIRDGYEFGWPVKTDFPFRREAAGGGVLIDLGVHVLDLVTWWFGDAESFEYWDNDRGGVESDCLLHVAMPGGGKGVIEFSRTRLLRNTAIISGDGGTLEVDLNTSDFILSLSESRTGITGSAFSGNPLAGTNQDPIELFTAQHDDWLDAVLTGGTPAVSATEARRSLGLVVDCYAHRKELELPWIETAALEEAVR